MSTIWLTIYIAFILDVYAVTVVEVNGFINKEWLLEIEAEAVVDER